MAATSIHWLPVWEKKNIPSLFRRLFPRAPPAPSLLWCNFSVETFIKSRRRSCLENPRVINHMSSSASTCSSYVNASVREELPSVPPLCPPAQRWQMWPPQWKYWESPGHLSGNIWAIWTITFCKWTQIKMYVVAFPGASASLLRFIPQPPLKYYHDVISVLRGGGAQPGVRSICCAERAGWPRSRWQTLRVSVWKLQVVQASWLQVDWRKEK